MEHQHLAIFAKIIIFVSMSFCRCCGTFVLFRQKIKGLEPPRADSQATSGNVRRASCAKHRPPFSILGRSPLATCSLSSSVDPLKPRRTHGSSAGTTRTRPAERVLSVSSHSFVLGGSNNMLTWQFDPSPVPASESNSKSRVQQHNRECFGEYS